MEQFDSSVEESSRVSKQQQRNDVVVVLLLLLLSQEVQYNNNNNRSFNMVKTHAQPYKHIIHTNTMNSLSRRTAITWPTHCHAGQQHLVSIHQMAPPEQGSTHQMSAYYSIYRPREDERLSWPSWSTYSGRFIHISGHPSAAGQAQGRKVRQGITNVLPLCYATNQMLVGCVTNDMQLTFLAVCYQSQLLPLGCGVSARFLVLSWLLPHAFSPTAHPQC